MGSGSRPGGRPLYATPLARRRDTLAFLDMAITDAHRLYAAGRR